MVSRKYVGDYKTEYVLGANGKIQSTASYAGKYFRFAAGPEQLKRTKGLFLGLAAAMWAAFILPLVFVSCAAGTWYSVLPHACLMLPLAYFTMAVYGLWTVKTPMIREQSDKVYERSLHCAAVILIMSCLSIAGFVLALILKTPDLVFPGDLVFGLCQALMLASAIVLFRNRHAAKTRETEAPRN